MIQLKFNYASSHGLSVGLKNKPDQVPELLNYFDFSLREQCYQYHECDRYRIKPYFNAEYQIKYRSNPERTILCDYSRKHKICTLILDQNLDGSFYFSRD